MPNKLPSILIGAAVYIALSLLLGFLQLSGVAGGALGCLIIFSAGLVAVWHYTATHAATISAGQGAGMGALAGLVGAVVGGLLSYLLIEAGVLPDPMEVARRQLEAQGMSGQQLDDAMAMAESFSNPVIALAIGAAMGAIFGAVSGALGAALFKKGEARPDLEGY